MCCSTIAFQTQSNAFSSLPSNLPQGQDPDEFVEAMKRRGIR